jgi:hypothetical protein
MQGDRQAPAVSASGRISRKLSVGRVAYGDSDVLSSDKSRINPKAFFGQVEK